jgi:NitT/TauT family transport system substrate-binding protein
MKKIVCVIAIICLLAGCGLSYEEKQQLSRQQRRQMLREDSAALKVAVLPTMDCLPLYVAYERGFFNDQDVDVRLKYFTAQMDCDTAVAYGRVEGLVSDLVRTERLQKLGTPLCYVAATNAYWQLITNRNARIRELKQLDDKMVAMTRYSATDLLTSVAVDSAKLKTERVFRIQINDVNIRLRMLIGNELDAMFLTEPHATQARQQKHRVLMDSRLLDLKAGVLAFSEKAMKNKKREQQLEKFMKAYNQACDSLACQGVKGYRDVVEKYCHVNGAVLDSLSKYVTYEHATLPRPSDVERAKEWVKNL